MCFFIISISLACILSGCSLRKSLGVLKQNGAISFDIETAGREIAKAPRSIDKTWYGNPYRWWSDVLDLDPSTDLLKLKIPIWVAMGEKDESVPVESARFLEAKFKEAGKDNLVLCIYPGADHRLNAQGVSYRDRFFHELGLLLQHSER